MVLMKSTIIFSMSAMFYILLLLISFFSKKYYKSYENKIYSYLLKTIFVGLLIELSGVYILTSDINWLKFIQMKFYQIYLITWIFLFTIYTLSVFIEDKESKKYQIILLVIKILYLLCSILIFVLPTNLYNQNDMIYTYGASVTSVYLFSLICIILICLNIIANFSKLLQKKYFPIVFFILLGVLIMMIQSYNPGLLLITSAEAFITYLMYFTIENPDIKMAKDLAFSKEIADRLRNKTLEILNNIEDKLEDSLNEMRKFGYKDINTKDIKEVNRELKYIQGYCIHFVDDISGLIDVSKIDSGSIKLIEEEYETNKLFEDIKQIFKYDKSRRIKVSIEIDDKMPSSLYGDMRAIKQMILYIYDYLVDVVDKDNLNIKIDFIVVGNFCKLKFYFSLDNIKISDYIYGDISNNIKYMKIKKQEKLINSKIVVVNDNELLVTVMQKIIDPYVKILENKENKGVRVKYFDASDKRILILDNNNVDVKRIMLLLKPYKIDVDVSKTLDNMNDKLSSNKTYDMVLVDSGIDTHLEEYDVNLLRKFVGYKFKAIIMLSKGKEMDKKEYLEQGYDDYIVKPIDKKSINDLMIRYIKD